MKRREFLKAAGTAMMAVPLAMALTACGGGHDNPNPSAPTSPTTPVPTGGDFNVTSNGDFTGHTHIVTVKSTDVTTQPSSGVNYVCTFDAGHTHNLFLSQTQLAAINGGGTVTATSVVDLTGHTHTWSIKKP